MTDCSLIHIAFGPRLTTNNCFCGSQVTKPSLDDCLTMMQVKVIQGHDDIRAMLRTRLNALPYLRGNSLDLGAPEKQKH